MIRLGSVIAQFEADFMTQFRHRLSFDQLRALSAMRDCRGPAFPPRQAVDARFRRKGDAVNNNGRVSFRYRNAKTGKVEKRALAGVDFLWLILQHVLPRGFRRARNFGFLHANCKRLIGLLQRLLKFDPRRFTPPRKERPAMLCSCCGAVMAIVRTRIRSTSPGGVVVPPAVGVAS